MAKNWRHIQSEIKELYLAQGKPLQEVRALMKKKHGFERSIRAYKNHLEQWECRKYKTERRMAARVASESRPRVLGTVGLVPHTVQGISTAALIGMEKELQHQTALVKEQCASLFAARQSLSTLHRAKNTEEIDKSIANIGKIEETINSMRKSLEALLATKSTQDSRPTCFASCWKQEPMILEDAFGKLIPIPLELVVSWEIFDDILISHFRTQPGSRKVSRREYAVEDSLTRCNLSRNRPWSFFCRPGRKIDMSMIFKNVEKPSVICPKCDTISMEKKGVLIECKTPGCHMLFRTEDEAPLVDKRISLKAPSGNIHVQDKKDNEVEDAPGIFKRVIIRVTKEDATMPPPQLLPDINLLSTTPPSQTPQINRQPVLGEIYAQSFSIPQPRYTKGKGEPNHRIEWDSIRRRGLLAPSQSLGIQEYDQRLDCGIHQSYTWPLFDLPIASGQSRPDSASSSTRVGSITPAADLKLRTQQIPPLFDDVTLDIPALDGSTAWDLAFGWEAWDSLNQDPIAKDSEAGFSIPKAWENRAEACSEQSQLSSSNSDTQWAAEQSAEELHRAKSFSDLRSYTPLPVPSTASFPVGLGQNVSQDTDNAYGHLPAVSDAERPEIYVHGSIHSDRLRNVFTYFPSSSTSTEPVPMSVPNLRDPVPPLLPPPRHLADIPHGVGGDIEWQWSDSREVNSWGASIPPLTPGSSLYNSFAGMDMKQNSHLEGHSRLSGTSISSNTAR